MSTSRPRRFMCVVWFLRNCAEDLYVIYALMDSSFWFNTINFEWSIVYIEGSQVIV